MVKYENREKDIFGKKKQVEIHTEEESLKKVFIARQGLIFAKN
ncbi:MAG: hypothetical protein ACI94Y_003716 [Maribacter sp.]|jgi:hypothetical protein